jgi:isocitrate dehydrogenase kinase/phosphatase
MPSFPVVFKIIKDRFDFPKECNRQQVIDRYRQVFKHDRAGRLVDAQEYEYLVLDRSRFDDQLLSELSRHAANTVSIEGDQVVIKHCYAERRVKPLDVFLREANEEVARAAVMDYGRAIKELALSGLFPGDLLLKNFGVTRNNRVVFYDYDEISLLSACNFRKLPDTGNYDDEIAGEPWFGVGSNDIFPEEFIHYLGLSPNLRKGFVEHHGDLLEAAFWSGLKNCLDAGELFHVPPYANCKRLDPQSPFGNVPVLSRAC